MGGSGFKLILILLTILLLLLHKCTRRESADFQNFQIPLIMNFFILEVSCYFSSMINYFGDVVMC